MSLKSVIAFFYSLLRLFQLIYFVKCWRTLPEVEPCSDPTRQGNVKRKTSIKGGDSWANSGLACVSSVLFTPLGERISLMKSSFPRPEVSPCPNPCPKRLFLIEVKLLGYITINKTVACNRDLWNVTCKRNPSKAILEKSEIGWFSTSELTSSSWKRHCSWRKWKICFKMPKLVYYCFTKYTYTCIHTYILDSLCRDFQW